MAVSFLLAQSAGQDSHFNPDESRWISRAHYLAALANPASSTWNDQYMTRGQPPLGSYAMGLALLLQGRDLQTNPPWDFSLRWEVNVGIGNKPSQDDLAAGRRASAALVALTSLVLIFVARVFVSPPWAVAAGALYAIHPFTIYVGSIALSDALFGFLIALAAWGAAAFGHRPTWRRAIILGALLGLGGSAKLSPLAVAAGLTAALGMAAIYSSTRQRRISPVHRSWVFRGLFISAAAIATFVAVYPYLWTDPITRTRNLFAFRADEMAAQASDWPVMAVPNRFEAVRRVHSNFSDRYNLSTSLMQWTGRGSAPALMRQVEILIAGAGVMVLAVRSARDGPASPRAFVLAVLGGMALITVLAMRSEFDRYHLPVAILGTVAAVAALEGVVALAPQASLRGASASSGPVAFVQWVDRRRSIRAATRD